MMEKQLSLTAIYDDLMRSYRPFIYNTCEEEFRNYVKVWRSCSKQWRDATDECQRLMSKLKESHSENERLVKNLNLARSLLDQEKQFRRKAEEERAALDKHLDLVREILLKDNRNKLHDETREKLQSFDKTRRESRDIYGDRLNTIEEMETTGSVLSDLSYSRSEDDLDISMTGRRAFKKCRPSPGLDEPVVAKRRRSANTFRPFESEGTGIADRLVATTTVTVDHSGGPISARSTIETLPGATKSIATSIVPPAISARPSAPPAESSDSTDSGQTALSVALQNLHNNNLHSPTSYPINSINNRPHRFITKTVLRQEICEPCGKRIRFGRAALKCQDCRSVSHPECKEKVPLPCVNVGNTPTMKGVMGTIADYTPLESPMVPLIVVHCIKEVEERGLSEVGLYRVPGSDKEVKALKEKFLLGRGAPNLSNVADIHTVCGCLKEFVRSLREPLVTFSLWCSFVHAAGLRDPQERTAALIQAVSELPQPNRDTLACLVLHLQQVAAEPQCKMPIANLAKVWGPTIVGYSKTDPENLYTETQKGHLVMEHLLGISGEYWCNFVRPNSGNTPAMELRNTPSNRDLHGTVARNCFTPISTRNNRWKKHFYSSPTD